MGKIENILRELGITHEDSTFTEWEEAVKQALLAIKAEVDKCVPEDWPLEEGQQNYERREGFQYCQDEVRQSLEGLFTEEAGR